MSNNLKLYIPEEIYNEIMYITKNVDTEVGGLLHVEPVRTNEFEVRRMVPLVGSATAASFRADHAEVADKYAEISEKDPTFRVNGCWHSHCNLGVFHSNTDNENIDSLLRYSPYVVSVVVNKKGEIVTVLEVEGYQAIVEPIIIKGGQDAGEA